MRVWPFRPFVRRAEPVRSTTRAPRLWRAPICRLCSRSDAVCFDPAVRSLVDVWSRHPHVSDVHLSSPSASRETAVCLRMRGHRDPRSQSVLQGWSRRLWAMLRANAAARPLEPSSVRELLTRYCACSLVATNRPCDSRRKDIAATDDRARSGGWCHVPEVRSTFAVAPRSPSSSLIESPRTNTARFPPIRECSCVKGTPASRGRMTTAGTGASASTLDEAQAGHRDASPAHCH